MIKVMFVCLGNICRSPAAEATLRHMAEEGGLSPHLEIDSSGLGAWHVGQQADSRMRTAAQTRGLSLVGRAKQFNHSHLDAFDYILASDHEVLNELLRITHTPEHKAKIHLMTAFSPAFQGKEVPDPYYNGYGAFEEVLDMLEDACEGLILHIQKQHNLKI